ncbi:MAG: hypothetical protein WCF85_20285 [Rhodospirillaceae bacterium]
MAVKTQASSTSVKPKSNTKIDGQSVREEDVIVQSYMSDQLRLEDGYELSDTLDNPILAEISDLAKSSDLAATQRTIIAYETGDAPLFRFLGRLLKLGELILASDQKVVEDAFGHLRGRLVDEEKKEKVDKTYRNPGIKNIGVPTIPVADQKFYKRLREDSEFLYKTLVNFYFPNASAPMRTQYYTVVSWAHEKQEPNFVTWLAGTHEYTLAGKEVIKNGLRGAYLKIRSTKISGGEDETDIKTDDEIEKAFENTNKVLPVSKPEWLEECVEDTAEPFMMLGRVDGDQIKFINYTTSTASHIKSSLRAARGSLYQSDLDYTKGDHERKMADAIKNLISFTGAPELIIWQDARGKTFVMPLYDEWADEDQPNVRKTDRSKHFAVILEVFSVNGADSTKFDAFEFPDAVDDEYNDNSDIFKVGYVTSQVGKIDSFNGKLYDSVSWVDDDVNVLEFMGAQWIRQPNRRPKKQNDNDKELKRKRYPTIPAYGYKYLMGCFFYQDGRLKYGERMTGNIDFALARSVFKKWSETRKSVGLSEYQTYITICVRNCEVGVWYENVVHDSITHYDNKGQLVKIGTLPDDLKALKGQWRVPTYQLRRVWNLLTGPWDLFCPYNLELITHHPESNIGIADLLAAMAHDPVQPPGFMRNLCSTREIDDGLLSVEVQYDDNDEIVTENRRQCVPLVLRCGALWMYLFSETRQ